MTPAAGKWEGKKKEKITNGASNINQMEGAKLVTTDAAVRRSARKRLPNQLMDDFVCKGYRKRNRRKKSIFDFDL
jgi:hypothetical protein